MAAETVEVRHQRRIPGPALKLAFSPLEGERQGLRDAARCHETRSDFAEPTDAERRAMNLAKYDNVEGQAKSNEALAQLAPDVQWVESYVAADKTFCVYLAKDEDVIRKHAEISGFPATKITPIRKMIDPTTEKDT